MSIQSVRRHFAVHLRVVIYVVTAMFVIGLPLVFVPGRFLGKKEEPQEGSDPQQAVIARVGAESVTRAELTAQFNGTMAQMLPIYAQLGQSPGVERLWRFRLDAAEQAITQKALAQKAREEGLRVDKDEVTQRAEQLVEQELSRWKSQYDGEQLERMLAYIASETGEVRKDRVSESWFRNWLKKRLLRESDRLEQDLIVQRLGQRVMAQVSATEQDLLASYDKATVREITVALRPPSGQLRTKEEARERADDLLARVKAGANFTKLARTESDAPDAEDNGGLREPVRRGRMPKEWDDAVFSLGPDEVSGPIELPWGYVIVKMEKIERELPDEFEAEKDELLNRFVDQKRQEAWREYETEVREQAEVEIVDPEILAYKAYREGDRERALSLLEEAAPAAREIGDLAAASVFYQLATLLAARNEWEEAADAYAQSHDALSHSEMSIPAGRSQALMGMGRSYENLGNIEDAVTWYQAAGDASETPSIHEQLLATYKRLDKAELVEREQEWLAEYREEELARQRQLEAQQRAAEEEEAPPTPPKESQ